MRTPYRFTTQIYSDPSAPLVDGFWYFTDLPFLNFASAFGSRIYDDNKTNLGTLGEQYQPDFPYSTSQPILGLTGGHECGTPDEFLWGLPYPPLGPPVRYDQDSIPLCCQRLPTPQVTAGSLAGSLISHAHVRASAVTAGASVASLLSHSPRTGSAVTSGASVTSEYSLSPVTPGPTCATSAAIVPDTGRAANGTPGVPQWWYGLHFGDAEHCAVFVSNSNLAELRIWLGSCAALSLFSVTTTGQNVHLPSLFEVWHFEILSPTTDVYSLQINSGACV